MGKPLHGNSRRDERKMSPKRKGKLPHLETTINTFNKIKGKSIYRKGEGKYIYPKYIKSPEWLARRIEFYSKFGRNCAACGTRNNTQIHHMSYKHLGKELDSELMVLCMSHHQDYHARNGVQSNMISKTHAYIKAEKEKLSRETFKEEAMGTL